MKRKTAMKVGTRPKSKIKKRTWRKPVPGVCRVCGCTDLDGCKGGCWWVDESLCSRCVCDGMPTADQITKLADDILAFIRRMGELSPAGAEASLKMFRSYLSFRGLRISCGSVDLMRGRLLP